MRYCTNCRHVTPGDPLYCAQCGRTYNAKLCPRHHLNPRSAQVCSQCGSRELSTPQLHSGLFSQLLQSFVGIFPGLMLVGCSLLILVAFVNALSHNPNFMAAFLAAGLLVALLWYLWLKLPHFLRHGLQRLFFRHRERNRERH